MKIKKHSVFDCKEKKIIKCSFEIVLIQFHFKFLNLKYHAQFKSNKSMK